MSSVWNRSGSFYPPEAGLYILSVQFDDRQAKVQVIDSIVTGSLHQHMDLCKGYYVNELI